LRARQVPRAWHNPLEGDNQQPAIGLTTAHELWRSCVTALFCFYNVNRKLPHHVLRITFHVLRSRFTLAHMAGTITALTIQKKNKERVNVYIDGRFAFGLAAIEAVKLRTGQKLSDDDIAALQNRDEAHQAHEAALRYLDYRPRSVAEIRRHLKSKDIEPDVIEEIVARLTSAGLLDDRAFARYWLENRQDFRPRGQRALRMELRQKGVPADIIDEALGQDHREDKAAYQAATAQARKIRTADPVEFRRKLQAHLARRGFAYDIAREAAARAWSECHSDTANESGDESEV
jgi:regulatory protein